MSTVLKQLGAMIVGRMGSAERSSMIVKTMRGTYLFSASAIAIAWYSAWRNERVAPGTASFPVPGIKKLAKRYPPDRPEKELPHSHREWGTSRAEGGPETPAGGSEGYVYPFSSQATEGRIDQGMDFGGRGPIFAIGDARILLTGAPGWPGGEGVVYQLLNGPRSGQCIYVYEGIRRHVRRHDVVKAGHPIGEFVPFSPTGIEIGFCDSSGVPLCHSSYVEGKETKCGKEMAAFLKELKQGRAK